MLKPARKELANRRRVDKLEACPTERPLFPKKNASQNSARRFRFLALAGLEANQRIHSKPTVAPCMNTSSSSLIERPKVGVITEVS